MMCHKFVDKYSFREYNIITYLGTFLTIRLLFPRMKNQIHGGKQQEVDGIRILFFAHERRDAYAKKDITGAEPHGRFFVL